MAELDILSEVSLKQLRIGIPLTHFLIAGYKRELAKARSERAMYQKNFGPSYPRLALLAQEINENERLVVGFNQSLKRLYLLHTFQAEILRVAISELRKPERTQDQKLFEACSAILLSMGDDLRKSNMEGVEKLVVLTEGDLEQVKFVIQTLADLNPDLPLEKAVEEASKLCGMDKGGAV